jgi:hypothetical protein
MLRLFQQTHTKVTIEYINSSFPIVEATNEETNEQFSNDSPGLAANVASVQKINDVTSIDLTASDLRADAQVALAVEAIKNDADVLKS